MINKYEGKLSSNFDETFHIAPAALKLENVKVTEFLLSFQKL